MAKLLELFFDPMMMWLVVSLTFVYLFAYVMNDAQRTKFSFQYTFEKRLDVTAESQVVFPRFIRQILFVRRKRPSIYDHHCSDNEDGNSLSSFE